LKNNIEISQYYYYNILLQYNILNSKVTLNNVLVTYYIYIDILRNIIKTLLRYHKIIHIIIRIRVKIAME